MKKTIDLKKFISFANKAKQKGIKLNVEGKFNKQGKFSLQIKNLECDVKLAKELGFEPIEKEKIVIIKNGNKKPTLKELMLDGFNNLNKRIDAIDKKVISIDKKVEKNSKMIRNIMNTPTMKKELNNSKKLIR